MFGFIKNMIRDANNNGDYSKSGHHANAQAANKPLNHPRDLRVGDIIKFQYLDQDLISGKTFEVAIINTYIYGELCYPELVLKDDKNTLVYLMTEEEDGEEYLALSLKIPKARLHELLPAADLESINAPGTGATISLAEVPPMFHQWVGTKYQKVDDRVKGSFLKGDARDMTDEEISRREHFSSHLLEDDTGEFAIEVENYSTGESEACITIYHDVSEIEEMWPKAS